MPQVQDTLSARRKADRGDMAQQVIDLAGEYGLAAWLCRCQPQPSPRLTAVDIMGLHGLRVTVKFDGSAASPDTYLLSWHGVEDGWRLHPGMFGNVNSAHGHKATDVARGFAQLTRILRERFAVIASGSAFVAEDRCARS
jgi:hypothetical protein